MPSLTVYVLRLNSEAIAIFSTDIAKGNRLQILILLICSLRGLEDELIVLILIQVIEDVVQILPTIVSIFRTDYVGFI